MEIKTKASVIVGVLILTFGSFSALATEGPCSPLGMDSAISDSEVVVSFDEDARIFMGALYGDNPHAFKKMENIGGIWYRLVRRLAFSRNVWGRPWNGQLAMADKEIVTLSGLIGSGLWNQIFLHIHGFLNNGGSLPELSALIRVSWPQPGPIPEAFVVKIMTEVDAFVAKLKDSPEANEVARATEMEAQKTQFRTDLKNKRRMDWSAPLRQSTPLAGFNRFQLAKLVATLAGGQSFRDDIKQQMTEAVSRGADFYTMDSILNHLQTYTGESSAVGSAYIWDEVYAFNDETSLARNLLSHSAYYYSEPEFNVAGELDKNDPTVSSVFDISMVVGSNRVLMLGTLLENYLRARGIDSLSEVTLLNLRNVKSPKTPKMDIPNLVFAIKRSARLRTGAGDTQSEQNYRQLINAVRAELLAIDKNRKKSAAVRRFARLLGDELKNDFPLSEFPVKFAIKSRLSLVQVVELGALLANGHTHLEALVLRLRGLQAAGLDQEFFDLLTVRAIQIAGFPVAMNGELAYRQAKQSP